VVTLAQNILAHSLSDNTRASYVSAVNHISKFYQKMGSNLVFPISPDTLCLWMADSIDKLSYSSIRHYLHGIATTQMELGHRNPLNQSPLLWRMFKAIKRIQGEQTVRKRLPITVKILSQIDPQFDVTKQSDLCMRAAMWFGTCGLLRSGEFTRKSTTKHTLKLEHLTFHHRDNSVLNPLHLKGERPLYMSLRLDQSKTDPFRRGTNVIISNPRAIEYMLKYLRHRNCNLSRQPLFIGEDGQALSTSALVKFTQQLITRANLPNANLFLGHSFRKGGATSLHEAGHPDSLIKLMGRWASFAFATYIDTPINMLIEAGRSLMKVVHPTNDSFWDVNSLI
jgi:hypothetical protein